MKTTNENSNGTKQSNTNAQVNDQVINNVKNAKCWGDYDYSLCKTVLDFAYMWCAKHYGVGKLAKYTTAWQPSIYWSEQIRFLKDVMYEEYGIKATYREIEENLIKGFEMTKNVKYATKILDKDGHKAPLFKVIEEPEIEAVKDYFKTAKGVNGFNGVVLSVKIDEDKDFVIITIETANFWAKVDTDYEVNILLRGVNFLTDDMVGDIAFIDKNKHNIISAYKNTKKQAA